MDGSKRNYGLNVKEYAYLNLALLFVFICALAYPIISIEFGINIKSCINSATCTSCGITRDLFDILTNQIHLPYRNAHSLSILGVLIFQILARGAAIFLPENKKIIFIGFDILATSITFLILFYLFNYL